MTSLKSKLLDTFKNFKSDAVPRPPRTDNEPVSSETEPNIEDTSNVTEDKPAPKYNSKKGFFKANKKKENTPNENKKGKDVTNVNTQAMGDMVNSYIIVNSRDVVCGNSFVYNMGVDAKRKVNKEKFQEEIQKDHLINAVLESKIKPEHEYIDYIAKNLGKGWHSFFRTLGYTQGRIETVEIDEAKNGVSEARYQLLLDWARNDEDGTLGKLATFLWDGEEREIVKELANIYKRNCC